MLADGYTDGRLGIAVGRRHGLQSCRVRPVRVRRPLGSPELGVSLPCLSVAVAGIGSCCQSIDQTDRIIVESADGRTGVAASWKLLPAGNSWPACQQASA